MSKEGAVLQDCVASALVRVLTINLLSSILSMISPPPVSSTLTIRLMLALPRREPGDVINDCKVHFLDEIYQMEKPGARPLSAADGPFKRT